MLTPVVTYLNRNRIAVLIALLFVCLGSLKLKFSEEQWQRGVVNSDGRGYYYFLPALSTWNFDYGSVLEQEEKAIGKSHQPYILRTAENRQVNKCYPGVALLQLPSYFIASSIGRLQGEQPNPYSDTHLYFFYWTSLLLLFLALIFLKKTLTLYFQAEQYSWMGAFLAVFATNVAYQAFYYPGISHHYTFFLFVLSAYFLLKWKATGLSKFLLFLACCLGVLLLIRPTNVLFVLFLPFLLRDWVSLKVFFKSCFGTSSKQTFKLVGWFSLMLSLLFVITYAQTGKLFYWSYQGEGFRWDDTHWFATWFSYRAGIFWHTPIVFLGLIALLINWKKWSWESSSLVFAFACLSLILGAWWCWDYQLFFGHRGFTEYQMFTGFLLVFFLQSIKRKWLTFILLSIPVFYMGIRTYQKISGIYPVQKFTATTYWKSMFDFNSEESDKYVYFTNCQPYGKVIAEVDLMKGLEPTAEMSPTLQFWPSIGYKVPKQWEDKRLFVHVKFDKILRESADWKDVVVVFAGKNAEDSLVHYVAYPAYTYLYEGKNEWVHHEIAEEFILQQEKVKEINVYLWNFGNKQFAIKNFEADLKVVGN